MSYYLGAAPIEEMDLSYAWGLSPAGATIKTVGDSGLNPGNAVTFTLGGLTFYGFVSAPVLTQNFGQGTKEDVKVADQRLMLMYDMIYGSFNVPEILEDNPLLPGINRQRRYAHILPADWENQKKTYTNTPLSAQAILDYCFGAASVHYSWERNYHARQANLVHEIDANSGKKLGNIVQEITEAQALVFALTSNFELTWVLKGDGALPGVPAGSTDIGIGSALTPNDTQITIIGDRNHRQVVADLEPDWEFPWQAFWLETDWLAEVDSQWGPFDSSQAGQASLAAKAREVTVRDYVTITGNADFADFRKWGEGICRMEIPAWSYLNDIVWKAYRVPPDTEINGIPLFSVDGTGTITALQVDVAPLLASVVGSPEGVITLKTPQELYPDGKAYILVQGVNVELLDPSTQGLITAAQLEDMVNLWTPCNRFTFDEKNLIIIFEGATFLPGDIDTGTGLFVFNNQGISGINNDDPLYNICMPNANVYVQPANVRACFCLAMERYASAETGSGTRHGCHYVSGLEQHLLDLDADNDEVEITYLNGNTADQQAALYLLALVGQQPSYVNGGYMRHGAAGTALSPVIDRVTVKLGFTSGLTERVEMTKERMPAVFMGERDLDRKQRTIDLFPGQRELRQEARTLRTIARVANKRTVIAPYGSVNDVCAMVVGAPDANVSKFNDPSGATWPGGMPVFFDKTTGLPSSGGTVFAGVTVADGGSGNSIAVAKTGTVPVRARSHFTIDVTPDSDLSVIAETLLGCGGSAGTSSNPNSIDLAMEIKPGMKLYSVPSSGNNYVTPFDLYSVFHAVVQAILAEIQASITGAFSLPTPELAAVEIVPGALRIPPPVVTFPSLSIAFPALNFEDFDPCLPLSSGAAAAVNAFSSYDFSSAFADVQALIAALDCTFAASATLPTIDASAMEAALEAAVQSLLCALAAVVDNVISNLDKILKLLEAIITDYWTRLPVGIARGEVTTDVTDTVLLPVDLNGARGEMSFISELSDTLFSVLKDIPLFGIAPARTVADLLSTVIPLVTGAINGVMNEASTEINTLASGLAAGVQGAVTIAKSAASEVVGLIAAEHAQVQAMLSAYATANQGIVDAAEQYMLKNATSLANLMINYLQAPYIASPTIYLMPSPYAGLSLLSDPTDFCDLATKLTDLATQLANPNLDTSQASWLSNTELFLQQPSGAQADLTPGDLELTDGGGSYVSVDASALGGQTAEFNEVTYFDDNGIAITAYILSTGEDNADDGSAFADAVKNVIAGLSWTVTCNGGDPPTFTITLNDGSDSMEKFKQFVREAKVAKAARAAKAKVVKTIRIPKFKLRIPKPPTK